MDQADDFRDMHDWVDAAAIFDRAVRVFADIVRPVVTGTSAARLSPTNIIMLAHLGRSGRARVGDIARSFRMPRSNVSYALKALVEAGCITLEKDPENRRNKIVVATKVGLDLARAVRARCASDQRPESGRRLRVCLEAADLFEESIELASVLAEAPAPEARPTSTVRERANPETTVRAGAQTNALAANSIASRERVPMAATAQASAGEASATAAVSPLLPRRLPRLPLARPTAASADR